MHFVAFTDSQGRSRDGRFKGCLFGFIVTFDFTVVEHDPFMTVIDNGIVRQSHGCLLPTPCKDKNECRFIMFQMGGSKAAAA